MTMRPATSEMKNLLEEIYSRLLNEFGHRNWWPGETRDEVIIGAILTQNVSWQNVEKAISYLKQSGLLTLEAIHRTDTAEIASLIKPTRFYNMKARKLRNFSDWLFITYGGDLNLMFQCHTGKLRQEMLAIGGLGEETVDSILLYAGNRKVFVVDAYTARIFSRLGIAGKKWRYTDYQEFFIKHLDNDIALYNDYHAQIVRLGIQYCKKTTPECEKCPLNSICEFPLVPTR